MIGHRFSPQAAWFPAEGALVGSAPCAGSSHGEAQTSWGLWSSLLGREDNLSKLCFKVYFHSFFFLLSWGEGLTKTKTTNDSTLHI